MIRTTVSAIVIASITVVFAQSSRAQSVAQRTHQPPILGQTGTMYDGNNVELRLPPEPNSYWANLWAASIPEENGDPAAGSAASSAAQPSGADVR